MPDSVQGLTSDQWAAITAVAAVAAALAATGLAVATYWLGRKTRDMAREARRLAGTTIEVVELLRASTKTQDAQTDLLRRQMEQAEADHRGSLRPRLVWIRSGGTSSTADASHRRVAIELGVRNEGPMAFLKLYRVVRTTTDLGSPQDTSIENEIQPGNRYPLHLVLVVPLAGGAKRHFVDVVVRARLLSTDAPMVDFPARVRYDADTEETRLLPVDSDDSWPPQ